VVPCPAAGPGFSRAPSGDRRRSSFEPLVPIADPVPEAVRLLILDDDEGVRLTFAKALALQGYSVRAAGSAREALYQIARERPDAILVDLKMPLVNGVGFLYRLRADPANQAIPVGVITGEVEVDEATADDLTALRAQVWHKPLSLEDVHEIARTLLASTPPGGSVTAPSRHL
jgi:CheY-like chemotaxis protein